MYFLSLRGIRRCPAGTSLIDSIDIREHLASENDGKQNSKQGTAYASANHSDQNTCYPIQFRRREENGEAHRNTKSKGRYEWQPTPITCFVYSISFQREKVPHCEAILQRG